MASDCFVEGDTSSWGQEGCRALWNSWKNLPACREGVKQTAIRRLEAWETCDEVEGFQEGFVRHTSSIKW